MFSFSISFERWHLPPVPSYVNKECIVELEGGWFSPYRCYWLIFPENSFMTRNGSNESSWWSDPFEKFWKLWNPFQERCDTHDILCNILRKWRVFWSPNVGLMRPPRLDEFISYFKAARHRLTLLVQERHTAPSTATPRPGGRLLVRWKKTFTPRRLRWFLLVLIFYSDLVFHVILLFQKLIACVESEKH